MEEWRVGRWDCLEMIGCLLLTVPYSLLIVNCSLFIAHCLRVSGKRSYCLGLADMLTWKQIRLREPEEQEIQTMSADLQTLIGKILTEENFAQALVDNPEQTLKEANIQPTLDLLDALKNVDVAALKSLAAAFGQNQAAV